MHREKGVLAADGLRSSAPIPLFGDFLKKRKLFKGKRIINTCLIPILSRYQPKLRLIPRLARRSAGFCPPASTMVARNSAQPSPPARLKPPSAILPYASSTGEFRVDRLIHKNLY